MDKSMMSLKTVREAVMVATNRGYPNLWRLFLNKNLRKIISDNYQKLEQR